MSKNTNQHGNRIYMQIRQEPGGTWSRNVWWGTGHVTNVRRVYGFPTRRAAREGDISKGGVR